MIVHFLFALAAAQDQPDRWAPLNAENYQYTATKSFFKDESGHGQSEFIQFYRRPDPDNVQHYQQVMSIRRSGIYTTAYWDDINQKAHFVYDKYSCNTVALPKDVSDNEPLFFQNPQTSLEYYFFPDLVALESDTMVTNVVKMENTTVIRNRPAWGWTATMHVKDEKRSTDLNIRVFYSIPIEEGSVSVPIRVEVDLNDNDDYNKAVNEIFNFRIEQVPDSIFSLPEMAPCKPTNYPLVPSMTYSFHAQMEVVDRTGWDDLYVFDLNIHYDAERTISTYKMATRGLPFLVEYFGDTKLSIVTDFDAELVFLMDQVQGNCSIFPLNNDDPNAPASDIWAHGGLISMKDPSYFWHIPDPTKYWYKGATVTREIGSQRWVLQPDHHDADHPPMTFEWEFANDSWVFAEGERTDLGVYTFTKNDGF